MGVPMAVWIAAGLGAAGIKIYREMRNVKQIIENAEARYDDEKYAFYQAQKKIMPATIALGKLKVESWVSLGRLATILLKMEHLPRQMTYLSFEHFRMGKPEGEILKEKAQLVQAVINQELAVEGTGIFTALCLYGATMTQKLDKQELNQLPGFPRCEQGSTILEALVASKFKIKPAGMVAEAAIINSLLNVPNLITDFGVTELDEKDKTKAMEIKDKIDYRSMELADAVGRIRRVHAVIERLVTGLQKLQTEYLVQIANLEALTANKVDFEKYDAKEQTLFVYTCFLVKTLRSVTRTDLLLKRGSFNVLNTIDIRNSIELIRAVFPELDPYAIEDAPKKVKK
ncbi:MAG: hypothetical protein RR321_02890 [Acidaminococcaceae bacterium]